jgi:hypothetical protein
MKKEKPVKYTLSIGGKSSSFHDTNLEFEISSSVPFPTFKVGDYIKAKSFDFQFERSDRVVVLDIVWDFVAGKDSTEIFQCLTVREEASGEANQRTQRMKKECP